MGQSAPCGSKQGAAQPAPVSKPIAAQQPAPTLVEEPSAGKQALHAEPGADTQVDVPGVPVVSEQQQDAPRTPEASPKSEVAAIQAAVGEASPVSAQQEELTQRMPSVERTPGKQQEDAQLGEAGATEKQPVQVPCEATLPFDEAHKETSAEVGMENNPTQFSQEAAAPRRKEKSDGCC